MSLRNIFSVSNLINENNLGDSNPTYLKHIHYFRGFAIISIFFVHLMVFPISKVGELSNLNVFFLVSEKSYFMHPRYTIYIRPLLLIINKISHANSILQ